MKRSFLALMFVVIMSAAACSSGVDQAAYDAVVNENEQLKSQVLELQTELDAKKESEKPTEDEITNNVAMRYIEQADRDEWWMDKCIQYHEIMLKDTSISHAADSLRESFDNNQQARAQYKVAIFEALSNSDREQIEKYHDEWTESIGAFCEAIDSSYEQLNVILKLSDPE